MIFTCTRYPNLRVLVKRGDDKDISGGQFAEFKFGVYETNDPEVIKLLAVQEYVYGDPAAMAEILKAKGKNK